MMLPKIYPVLKASPVWDMTSGQIYRHGSAPQDSVVPYVTWSLVAGVPENSLSELPSIDRNTIQVDCWSDDDADVESLSAAVRDALEPYAHMTSILIDSQETDTKFYRISLQFDWWQSRPGP